MKTVYTCKKDLIDLWITQQQNYARIADNRMFFSEDCIYSYSYNYIIAKILKNKVALINKKVVSSTTSRQKGIVSNALLYNRYKLIPVYSFDNIMENVECAMHNIKKLVGTSYKIGKSKQSFIMNTILETRGLLNEMTNVKRLSKKIKKIFIEPIEIEELVQIVKKEIEKDEKKWRKFDIGDSIFKYTKEVILRAGKDSVQTSMGNRIPKDIAREIYLGDMNDKTRSKLNSYIIINKEDFKRLPNGDYQIGCTTISKKEADRIAKQEKWI